MPMPADVDLGSLSRMSQSAVQVQQATQFLMSGDFTAALTASKSAVDLGSSVKEQIQALVLTGKAFFCSGDYQAASKEYNDALDLDENSLEAWEGIAELKMAENDLHKAVEIYRKLLRMAIGPEEGRVAKLAKAREFRWRLAECYSRQGALAHAEVQLRELLRMQLASHEQRLEALCFLADIQIKVEEGIQQREVHTKMMEEGGKPRHLSRTLSTVQRAVDAQRANAMEAEGGLAQTLQQIVSVTSPSPRFLKYFEQHLQRHLSLLGAYPPKSAARQEKRLAALRTCKSMIEATRGGCCTPFPFEAAIWLWEETEELYGGQQPTISRHSSVADLQASSRSSHGGHLSQTGGLGSLSTSPRVGPLSTDPRSGPLSTNPRRSHASRPGSRGGSQTGSPVVSPRGQSLSGHTGAGSFPHRTSSFMSTDPRAHLRESGDGGSVPHSPRHLRSPRASQTGRSPQPPSPMRRALEINSSRPPVSPQQLHSRGASLAGTPMGGASLAGGHPFRRGEAAEDPGHTTDLSVAYSLARRSTSFSGGRPTAEILAGRRSLEQARRSSFDDGAHPSQDYAGSAFMQMMTGGVAASPFGLPPPGEEVERAGPPDDGSGCPRSASFSQEPRMRPRSNSLGAIVLPLDTADSIRNVCVNTSCGNDLVTSKVEACGLTLAHQFPWAPSACVAVGLAMRRRLLSDPLAPSTKPKRQRILRYLKRGVAGGADCAAGWMGLAELQYQERKYEDSYHTGVAGLAWSVRRRQRGHETLGQFALSMRLIVAKALRRMGRLQEAEFAFKVLAGWVSEGESAFSDLAGSAPRNIHQEALRGIAKVLLERGQRAKAKWQYEKILGKALLGRGRAEHWAHSEYAWIAFQDGDLPTAKQHLELAIEVATELGSAVTEWELAEHHFRLGRVMWDMHGLDRHQARDHFQMGSAEEGHVQAEALAWLGVWEAEEGANPASARELFQAALELDPQDPTAAKGLKSIMGPDMDRVGSLADWGGDKQPPRESSPRPFPGF
mmetsp:Transcript_3540/g.10271  ORF Transcript_3540/g.10271 Transcript_3540/m.10271 type:complete len:1007 (-) Transcript_3540:744-3764(-)